MGHAYLLLKWVIRAGVWTGMKLAPKNQRRHHSCAPATWACVLFLLMSPVTRVAGLRLSVALMLAGKQGQAGPNVACGPGWRP